MRSAPRMGRGNLESTQMAESAKMVDSASISPKVSVITVVRNNAAMIERCVRSVLAQTYPNIEYVVIDGASDDGTLEILQGFGERIDLLVSEPDGGIYEAMNKGLAQATGAYICFLNADDSYTPEAVEASMRHILEHDLEMSYAGFVYERPDGVVAELADEPRPWDASLLVQGMPGGHETIFARREVYDRIGPFDTSFRLAGDYDWVIRAFRAGVRARPLFRNILTMSMGGASFNPFTERLENFRLLCREFGPLDPVFLNKLYELKFYRNWHQRVLEDTELLEILDRAGKVSPDLHKAVCLTIEQRKMPVLGKILPESAPGKKRIAICLTWLSGVSGGAERIAVETANGLYQRGHPVTLVCVDGRVGGPYYSVDPGVPVINLGIYPYSSEYLTDSPDGAGRLSEWTGHDFPRLGFVPDEKEYDAWNSGFIRYAAGLYRGFLAQHDFDVVISHMPSTWPQVLASRPDGDSSWHVACLHNAPGYKFYSSLYDAPSDTERYMRLATLDRADEVTVIFDEFVEQMPDHLKDRTRVLPNYAPFPPVEDPIDRSSSRTILSVGRLVPQKNHADLLRAFARVKERHPDWELEIYGQGELRDELEDLALELGLEPAGIFRGLRSDIDVAYRDAAIFAFPSLFEGFGLALAEAMSFGLPVIAFQECEGARNLFRDGEAGFLVERDATLDGLTDALMRLVEDANLRERLGAGALEAVRQFSIEKTLSVLEEIIDNAPGQAEQPPAAEPADLQVGVVCSFREGGAGIAAERLSHALARDGVSTIDFSLSSSEATNAFRFWHPPESGPLFVAQECIDTSINDGATAFSIMFPGIPNGQLSKLFDCDVINLHWVSRSLTPEQIVWIASSNRPVIWTLHDMNPFTGGCHYSDGCNRYRDNCEGCPQLRNTFGDFPTRLLQAKCRIPGNVTLVAPSRWLADRARESAVFSGNRIEVIPNGVDTDLFAPSDRGAAKRALGLPQDKTILLFACNSLAERRKGLAELLAAIERVPDFGKRFHVIALGNGKELAEPLGKTATALGFLKEEAALAQVYNAADLTVLPSLEDNLPNVILESAACGTPVLAFDTGGISEAVVEGITGQTVPVGDVEALARAVDEIPFGGMRERARAHAVENWSLGLLSARYSLLFRELLADAAPARTIAETGPVPAPADTTAHLAAMLPNNISGFAPPLRDLQAEVATLQRENGKLERMVSKMKPSVCWKIVQPFRWATHRLRDLLRGIRRFPPLRRSVLCLRDSLRVVRRTLGLR